jgi:hypothetical protein
LTFNRFDCGLALIDWNILFLKTVLVRITMSAESIDLESITTLFDFQLSGSIRTCTRGTSCRRTIAQYELLTTTNFACIKQNQGFGSTGKVSQKLYVNLQEEGGEWGGGLLFFAKSWRFIIDYYYLLQLLFTIIYYYHYCLLIFIIIYLVLIIIIYYLIPINIVVANKKR